MFILTNRVEVYDSKYNFDTFISVLDTKDGTVESYTEKSIRDLASEGIEMIGVFNTKILIIDEFGDFVPMRSSSYNKPFFKHNIYFSHIADGRMYLSLTRHYNRTCKFDIYTFSILISDFYDFKNYLHSIGKYIRFDKRNLTGKLDSWLNQYKAKVKLLYGVVNYSKSSHLSYEFLVDFGDIICLYIFYTEGNFDKSFFDNLLKVCGCKYLSVYDYQVINGLHYWMVGYPLNKLSYIYSSKLENISSVLR